MQRWQAVLITMACVTLGTACVNPIILAPGADQVRLTKNPGDVANCAPSGNIRQEYPDIDGFRNRVVGLGGNAALVTEGSLGFPLVAVVYRCP
jgi:hypothetical protein